MSKHLFTEEEKEFIKNHVLGYTTQETADMLNKVFNRNFTAKQITYFKQHNRLVSGFYGPKKGTLPPNVVPIGTETMTCDGHIIVKVGNEKNCNSRKNWKYKQRLIWEKAYGKIPDDCVVIFADQDRTNFSLDNLILAKRSELLTARTQHLIFDEPELTKTGLMLARLMNKTRNERRNEQ